MDLYSFMVEPGPKVHLGMRDCIPDKPVDPQRFTHGWTNIRSTMSGRGVAVRILNDPGLLAEADSVYIEDRLGVRYSDSGPSIELAYPEPDNPRFPEMDHIPNLVLPRLRAIPRLANAPVIHVRGRGIYHDIGDEISCVRRTDGQRFLFVGMSTRTSPGAVDLLSAKLPGVKVVPVTVYRVPREKNGALHLDSAATCISYIDGLHGSDPLDRYCDGGPNVIMLRPNRVDPQPFIDNGFEVVEVDDNELSGGAALMFVGNDGELTAIVPEECPGTIDAIERADRRYRLDIEIIAFPLEHLLHLQAGPSCTRVWIAA